MLALHTAGIAWLRTTVRVLPFIQIVAGPVQAICMIDMVMVECLTILRTLVVITHPNIPQWLVVEHRRLKECALTITLIPANTGLMPMTPLLIVLRRNLCITIMHL